jgi:hypothetical protein
MQTSTTNNQINNFFMKSIYICLALICFVGAGVGLTGCYKDIVVESDPDGPPQPVSFKDELLPVFVGNCALSGCHATGGHTPDLSADKAYASLNNGFYVNTLIPRQSKLYLMINGEMSNYVPSPAVKKKMFDWIRNGAPNN